MVALVAGRKGRGILRRVGRSARKVAAAALGPLLTVGGMALPPVAVTAAAAAGVAAGSMTPANAASGPPVAVVLVNGENSAPETAVLQAAGYSVTQVTRATLAAMSQSAFQGYVAVVIGDSSTSTSCSTTAPSTSSLGSQWEQWVNGNVSVVGTAPAMPGTPGADALIADAVGYAAAQPSSGSVTGLYVSLDCGYSTAAAGTAVSLLSGVDGIGAAGGVTVNGSLACSDQGTVNKWEAAAAGTFGGFTSSSLETGAWPSPTCPVQEAFDTWPAMFTPVAYDASSDATGNFTASDGATGQPYILLGTPESAATAALAPGTGGEVPQFATAGGANPAAPGLSQATAGDPVNTENGDFTQSATDFSIPGFGPALDFTRTYDAQTARQQTVAGTPGPMGYGWTDNWATSLTTGATLPGDIYAIAGLHTASGNGGTPTSQSMWNPGSVTEYGGNTYIADTGTNRVLEIAGATGTQYGISMTAGDMYTIAGSQSGAAGQTGDGTAAANTLLNAPSGIAVSSSGVYIADSGNCRVVELAAATGTQWGISMTAGDMYGIAGRGPNNCGVGMDNKVATQANLSDPTSVSLSVGAHAGDLYIADVGNSRIQEIAIASGTEWGQSMTATYVYTVAGSAAGDSGDTVPGGSATSALLDAPAGVQVDGSNNLYIADSDNCRVLEVPWASGTQWAQSMTAGDIYTVAGRDGSFCGGGGLDKPATQSDLNYPTAMWVGNSNLYIADSDDNQVREVAGSGHTEFGQTMTADYVYSIAGVSSTVAGYSGDGGPAGSAMLSDPDGVWVDGSGNLMIADQQNNRIREVNASTDDISTIAGNSQFLLSEGDGGSALAAGFLAPGSLTTDAQGDLFIADSGNNRVREVAASNHTQFGIAMTAGSVYNVAGSANGSSGTSGDGGPATAALLNDPAGVALDPEGNLYIVDNGNNRVQEVAAVTGTHWGQSMTAGDVYTIAGSASGNSGDSGDGGPAGSALLNLPYAITLDSHGNIYISDRGNARLQEVAAVSGTQRGQSMTAGDVYTIAGSASGNSGDSGDGGPATSALLGNPTGIAVDTSGNIYISDANFNVVREVAGTTGKHWGENMTANDIYTIAGQRSQAGYTGDGGPSVDALLNAPMGVSVDSSGDLYIADDLNSRVQEVAQSDGTQWSRQMTAGDIYTVAGNANGTFGDSGSGGPATSAELDNPNSVSIEPNGNLLIADQDSSSMIEAVHAEKILEVTATSTSTFPTSPVGGGVTVTQADGSQVTFYPQVNSACTAPYVVAGGYCTLPENINATLAYTPLLGTYTYSPTPGATYTYDSAGALLSESDSAGETLTLAADTPAPGSGQCPSTANSCQSITAASGRTLVIGSNNSGLITSVTDPLGRQWTYAYNFASQLTSATDPMGHVTTYTYGPGTTGNPQLANDLLTITAPNAQPGGPDAGDATANVYDSVGRVTSQTDPMGFTTGFNYCVSASDGDCMNPATGTGLVTVTDPDGNSTVYDYLQGTLAAQSSFTGTSLTTERDDVPATSAGGSTSGTLLITSSTDGDGNTTTYAYNAVGDLISEDSPGATGTPATTTTAYTASLQQPSCDSTAETASAATCSQDSPPTPMAPGGVINPPSSIPPEGVTYTLYDADGNELYATIGVYEPGATTASYAQTTYQLFKGNTVTLNGPTISCSNSPPSPSLPCAKINADGVVTQLGYDSAGDLVLFLHPGRQRFRASHYYLRL